MPVEGGMNYESFNLRKVKRYFRGSGIEAAGPFYHFLFKHIGIMPKWRVLTSLFSFLSIILATLIGKRWIEVFLIYKRK